MSPYRTAPDDQPVTAPWWRWRPLLWRYALTYVLTIDDCQRVEVRQKMGGRWERYPFPSPLAGWWVPEPKPTRANIPAADVETWP